MRRPTPVLAGLIVAILAFPVSAETPFVSEIVHGPGVVGTNVSMALGSDGTPHLVYWDFTNLVLLYATQQDGTWVTEIIEATAFVGEETAIAIDSQGQPHVSFQNYTPTTGVLRYARRNGNNNWATETVDTGLVDVGRYNSLALDANDKAHISYFIGTLTYLAYATNAGGSWNIEFVDPSDFFEVGYFTSIAVDNEGRPHISYVSPVGSGLGELWYTFKNAGTWEYHQIVVCGLCNNGDLQNSLALDSKGRPHIAHYSLNIVSVASMNKTGTVDYDPLFNTANNIGSRISLALDADDSFHVAYYDEVLGDLRYAARADTGWVAEAVDITGDVGDYASLALDGEGTPVIAYFDRDNLDVKIADARIHLLSPLGGETWPVGGTRDIEWSGGGTVDILLSTDGGSTFDTVANNIASGPVDGRIGGKYPLVVPHTPSRFCVVKLERDDPFATDLSDTLFTIETSISLLSLLVARPDNQPGNLVTWTTDPGPTDLGGYRLERRRTDAWETIVQNTAQTSYHDVTGETVDNYRLFASNRLGEEFYLGETSQTPALDAKLKVWPVPYSGGDLNVSFPTGAAGGVAATSEITVYDVAGRRVAQIGSGVFGVGVRTVTWNGRDLSGHPIPSGVYFVRVVTGGVQQVHKFVIAR